MPKKEKNQPGDLKGEGPGEETELLNMAEKSTPEEPADSGAEAGEVAETKEEKEEREREAVIALLHTYYQEQQRNTPTHRELARVIEEAKKLAEQALPYFKLREPGFKPEVRTDYEWGNKEYTEIGVVTAEHWGLGHVKIVDYLLDRKGEEARKLGEELSRLFRQIEDLRLKLWEEKENLARELLQLPEYSEWQRAEFKLGTYRGVYGADTDFSLEKEFYSEGGSKRTEKLDYWERDAINRQIMERYSITPEERDKIVKIEWTVEEREKLTRFLEAVEFFGQAVEQAVPPEGEDFSYTETERKDLIRVLRRGQARKLYQELGLPPQHREWVIQEIMLGRYITPP